MILKVLLSLKYHHLKLKFPFNISSVTVLYLTLDTTEGTFRQHLYTYCMHIAHLHQENALTKHQTNYN